MFSEINRSRLEQTSFLWLVTGVAGFIGSHVLQSLLGAGQRVIGLDNFATGKSQNLDEVRHEVGEEAWKNFELVEGDILDQGLCISLCKDADFVLHQAALGSVPMSIEDPIDTHRVNVSGFLNILNAARLGKIKKLVYASSCSVYGDNLDLPLAETSAVCPLSPYAASKLCNEIDAQTFSKTYGLQSIGLRYFNVYGERQDPGGAYAAVIPKWIERLYKGQDLQIYGDGQQTRDFVYVKDVATANIQAALGTHTEATAIFNVASGVETSLLRLAQEIQAHFASLNPDLGTMHIKYSPSRVGDIRFSSAEISRICKAFAFEPRGLSQGLHPLLKWTLSQQFKVSDPTRRDVPRISRAKDVGV